MLKFASAAALCIVVVLSLSLSQSVEAKHPRRTVEHFEAFLTEHKRSYAGAEYFTRLDIFAENLRLIEESNADASKEFTLSSLRLDVPRQRPAACGCAESVFIKAVAIFAARATTAVGVTRTRTEAFQVVIRK